MDSKQFEQYQLVRQLGASSKAVVYYARDLAADRDVALKILSPASGNDEVQQQRFVRQARTVLHLKHPAIVPLYEVDDSGERPYLMMRYMAGGNFAERLRRDDLSLKEIANLIQQLAGALDTAHSVGIVHQNIKPNNILFDDSGNAFLSDFGGPMPLGVADKMTESFGRDVAAYTSPEQASGAEEIDGRSDLYALGVILYQAISGRLPYWADRPVQLAHLHIHAPVPAVQRVDPELQSSFDHLLTKALAKQPNERFQTAAALSETLHEALFGEAVRPLAARLSYTVDSEQSDYQRDESAAKQYWTKLATSKATWTFLALLLTVLLVGSF